MNKKLEKVPNWVCYQQRPKLKDGKPMLKPNGKPKMDKIPKNPHTGGNAKTNDSTTWSDYETAVQAMQRCRFDGVGFVFTKEAGITGIDLDDCIDEEGHLSPFAIQVIEQLDSYTEYSPSGDGVHILAGGHLQKACKNGRIEMYDNGRFFTYTGKRLPNYDKPIGNRQAELDQLFAQVAHKSENPSFSPTKTVELDEQTLLEKARMAANGAKFEALWGGDWQGYESQSEADLALCHLLAFWTGKDMAVMDRLFRQSKLFRQKWDEKHYSDGSTYGKKTIERAVANTKNVYEEARETAVTVNVNGQHGKTAVLSDAGTKMPALPQTAWIDPQIGADSCPWLDSYIEFSRYMSPRGYEDFHEAIGLWALSVIAARRLTLNMGIKSFYPNLYIALCAYTTLYAKTTTVQPALKLLEAANLTHLLLPNDLTPQAFINQLVGRLRNDYGELTPEAQQWERLRMQFPGQKGWFYEEFGTKVSAMMREGGFMADFRGLLRSFEDNPESYEYVTMTRRDRVKRPYLAMLVNLTPADIKPYAKPGAPLWQDGFWARWTLITPPTAHAPNRGRFPEALENIPAELTAPLTEWHKRLGIPDVSIEQSFDDEGKPTGNYAILTDEIAPKSCSISHEAMDAFYAYHDGLVTLAVEQANSGNGDLIGNYGRLAEKAMRIAMLLASLTNQNRIELRHWARAQTIAERWRANLHNLAEQTQAKEPSSERQLQEKIVDVLRRHQEFTASEISRYIRNFSAGEIEEMCKRLVKSDVLHIAEETRRKTNRYALVES